VSGRGSVVASVDGGSNGSGVGLAREDGLGFGMRRWWWCCMVGRVVLVS